MSQLESATLRALHALVPYGFSCLTCLVSYVLSISTCSRVLHAIVSHVPRAIRGIVPHVACALRAPVFHVPLAFFFFFLFFYNAKYVKCLVPYWPRVSRFMSRFSLRILLFRTLRTLCPSITFCALEFPCISLLFFCPFSTYDFLEEIY